MAVPKVEDPGKIKKPRKQRQIKASETMDLTAKEKAMILGAREKAAQKKNKPVLTEPDWPPLPTMRESFNSEAAWNSNMRLYVSKAPAFVTPRSKQVVPKVKYR